jgi:hypothetical protein
MTLIYVLLDNTLIREQLNMFDLLNQQLTLVIIHMQHVYLVLRNICFLLNVMSGLRLFPAIDPVTHVAFVIVGLWLLEQPYYFIGRSQGNLFY